MRGRLPTPAEVRVLDAVLNAVLDYALLKPGTVAARYAVSAQPEHGRPASPRPCCRSGSYTLAPEDTARFILDAHDAHGGVERLSSTRSAAEIVADARARKRAHPGVRSSALQTHRSRAPSD